MRRALIGVLLVMVTVGCNRVESPGSWPVGEVPTGVPSADCSELARANNDFALKLYAQLAGQDGNLFLSPSSIHTVLTMTSAGARGKTLEQMAATLALPTEGWSTDRIANTYRELLLRLKPTPAAGYKLTVANALWGQKGTVWEPHFLSLAQDHYGAGLREVDYKGAPEFVCQEINRWVEENTNRRIENLAASEDVNRDVRLVLANAVYFKGAWVNQFKTNDTKDRRFYITPEKPVSVPMMYQEATFPWAETDEIQVLSMPYTGKDLSMVILLPRERNGLAQLEENLSRAIDLAVPNAKKAGPDKMLSTRVNLWLPRFTMNSKLDLIPDLASIGMKDVFTEKADLTGIAEAEPLYISKVLHQAFVDANERGTEAAAGSVVMTAGTHPEFRADHPFVFLILHEPTGTILFMGRMTDPSDN